jgi:hypothetical protein
VTHTITVDAIGGGFAVSCSCGELLEETDTATLDELTRLADEHITAADRGQ